MSQCHNEAIIARFGEQYLDFHRENYLDSHEDIRPLVMDVAQSLTVKQMASLLSDDDWRVRLVGIFCFLVGQDVSFCSALSKILIANKHPVLRRAVCIPLVLACGDMGVETLVEFLRMEYQSDCLAEYAAALEGLAFVSHESYDECAKSIVPKIMNEGHSEAVLKESRSRFRKALDYWKPVAGNM